MHLLKACLKLSADKQTVWILLSIRGGNICTLLTRKSLYSNHLITGTFEFQATGCPESMGRQDLVVLSYFRYKLVQLSVQMDHLVPSRRQSISIWTPGKPEVKLLPYHISLIQCYTLLKFCLVFSSFLLLHENKNCIDLWWPLFVFTLVAL